jgi:hypothetical protein
MPHLRSFGVWTRRCQADSQFPFNFYVVSIFLSFSLSLSLFLFSLFLSLFFSLCFSAMPHLRSFGIGTGRHPSDSQLPFSLYVVSIFLSFFSLSFFLSLSLSLFLSLYLCLCFSLGFASSSFLWPQNSSTSGRFTITF